MYKIYLAKMLYCVLMIIVFSNQTLAQNKSIKVKMQNDFANSHGNEFESNGVERGGWPYGLITFKTRIFCQIPIINKNGKNKFVVLLSKHSRSSKLADEGTINVMMAFFVKDKKIYQKMPINDLLINYQAQNYKQVAMKESIYSGSSHPYFIGRPKYGKEDPLLNYWLRDTKNLPNLLLREIHYKFTGTLSIQKGSLPEEINLDLKDSYKCRKTIWYIPLFKNFKPIEQDKFFTKLSSITSVAGDFYFGFSSLWYMKLNKLFIEIKNYQTYKYPLTLDKIKQLIDEYQEDLLETKQKILDLSNEYQADTLHINFSNYLDHYDSIIKQTEKAIQNIVNFLRNRNIEIN